MSAGNKKHSGSSTATVTGVVHLIEETKSFGAKGFRKRTVVLEQDNGRFTNYIPLEFIQDGCDAVDEMREGDEVEITYRLSGRKWQRDPASEVKYFLSAEATGFQTVGSSSGTSRPGPAAGKPHARPAGDANSAFSEASDGYEDGEVPF